MEDYIYLKTSKLLFKKAVNKENDNGKKFKNFQVTIQEWKLIIRLI